MVEVCNYIFICFYIGFTRSKNFFSKPYYAALGCKHDLASYRELSFFSVSSGKTDNSEAMNSQLRAGILKSRVLKFIYFHQLMGQDQIVELDDTK